MWRIILLFHSPSPSLSLLHSLPVPFSPLSVSIFRSFFHSKLWLSYFSLQKSFKITLVQARKQASNHWGMQCIRAHIELTACKQNAQQFGHVPNSKWCSKSLMFWHNENYASFYLGNSYIFTLCENYFRKFTRICCSLLHYVIGAIYSIFIRSHLFIADSTTYTKKSVHKCIKETKPVLA